MSEHFQLSQRKAQISRRLDDLKEGADFETEWSDETLVNLVQLAKRGKMLRGSLLLEACDTLNSPEPVNYAAAIELVHTGLLVHDDIIDEDDERRGMEAIHSRYSGKGERFGRGVAICIGDITYFLALKLISDSEKKSHQALQAISECFIRTGFGQIVDVENSLTEREPGEDEIEEMYREKTASYTFELPLRLASILSNNQDSEQLADVGRKLGVLFQIKDDHLELFSNGETGKPDLSDIMQNKKTVHRKRLLDKAENPEQIREKMEGETSRKEAEEVLDSFHKNDLEEVMRQEIGRRKEDLENKIRSLEKSELSELLQDVVERVVEREK